MRGNTLMRFSGKLYGGPTSNAVKLRFLVKNDGLVDGGVDTTKNKVTDLKVWTSISEVAPSKF